MATLEKHFKIKKEIIFDDDELFNNLGLPLKNCARIPHAQIDSMDHNENLSCQTCKKTFVSDYSKTRHTCSKKSPENGSLDDKNCNICLLDIAKVSDIKQWTCRTCMACEKHLSRKNKWHQCVNEGDGPFVCNTCLTRYPHYKTLEVHLRSHSIAKIAGTISYSCKVCSQTFKNKKHNCGKDVACNQCGKIFSSQAWLDMHLFTHSGVKPYICQTCSRPFRRPGDLILHCRRSHKIELVMI